MMRHAEVIGDPISHSKSPLIHKFWLQALDIDADYRAVHVKPDELGAYIQNRSADRDWRGCNVTIPHKIAVIDLVADPGDIRSNIGAMNTIARGKDGELFGTNTDAAGFYSPIAGLSLEGVPVAVVGSGGAAQAVLFALARCGAGEVTVLARSPMKAMALLQRFGLKGQALPIGRTPPPVQLLVNASALGMTGQPPLDIELSSLPDDCVIYDIVYAPLQTPLLAAAQARGLETIDGLEMLIGQAALAFEIFFGASPPRERDAELRALLTA